MIRLLTNRSVGTTGVPVAILAAALASSCTPTTQTPTPKSGEESPTDRAAPPDPNAQLTPEEVGDRFSHTDYPTEVSTSTGPLGKARNGTLIASTGSTNVSLESTWESGPAVIVFYRGHW